jgi:uncharacterized tellurite resistance protein B-like protein
MLNKIREFFQVQLNPANDANISESRQRLACAALLIEVAVIDNEFDGNELAALKTILISEFHIAPEEIEALITLAHNECADATSMYQFTQLVNQHCGFDEKFALVTNMWRIAYADGDLDKYEEYIIRKVSDLIHLGHGEFIRAKHAARSKSIT